MRDLPDSAHPGLKLWIAWARALRRWHRYEVSGLEHLDAEGPTLVLGYHGRNFATDLIILNDVLLERHGRLPVSVMHAYTGRNPFWRWINEGIEGVTGDGEGLARAIAERRTIILLPGGNREANRSYRVRYQVDWGDRTGYLKLALRHRLRIVPVAASGVDDTYIGLNDGYTWGKRLGLQSQLPMWLALGPLGLVPFTPPFPVKVRQRIGAPIDLYKDGPVDLGDRRQLLALHRQVVARMQALLDEARTEEDYLP
jgi:1-acyl-sn-glycerol-3-phosphate acyltransferase